MSGSLLKRSSAYAKRHVAMRVVMAVRFAVGGDVDELRMRTRRVNPSSSRRQISRRVEDFSKQPPRDSCVIEKRAIDFPEGSRHT